MSLPFIFNFLSVLQCAGWVRSSSSLHTHDSVLVSILALCFSLLIYTAPLLVLGLSFQGISFASLPKQGLQVDVKKSWCYLSSSGPVQVKCSALVLQNIVYMTRSRYQVQ